MNVSRIFPLLHLGNSSCHPPKGKWASTHQNKYPGGLHLAWVVLDTDLWFIFFYAPNPITLSFAYCPLMVHYLIVNKCSNLKYATRLHTANFSPCKMYTTLGAFCNSLSVLWGSGLVTRSYFCGFLSGQFHVSSYLATSHLEPSLRWGYRISIIGVNCRLSGSLVFKS